MMSMKIAMIGVVYTGTLHGHSATVYIYRNDVGLINHVFVLPASTYLFVSWKQTILNWTTGSGDNPEDLQALFFLTAEIDSAPSSSLVSGVSWTCAGYNTNELASIGNPVYELDTLPITMAGQVCYENATTSSQAIANLKLQIAPSFAVAYNYTCSLSQGHLHYYILRK